MFVHKIIIKRFVLLLASLTLVCIPIRGLALGDMNVKNQVGVNSTLCVSSQPDITNYPEVGIDFRLFDAKFVPVTTITDPQLRISDNNQPALPLQTGVQRSPVQGGIDFYFVLDRSNRATQSTVRGILQEFMKYYQQEVDTVTIYTDSNNADSQYFPGSGFDTLAQSVANYPSNSEDSVRTIKRILDKLVGDFANSDICSNPKIIYFILGDGTFEASRSAQFAEIAKLGKAKIVLFHLPNPRSGSFGYSSIYESAAANAGGAYRQVLSPSDDSGPVFDQLLPYRQVFTAGYNSNNGDNGFHTIQAEYEGAKIATSGNNTYSITLLPAKVSLLAETVVSRNALEKVDNGFIYDKNSVDVTVKVAWPDGYRRQLSSAAVMIIRGLTGEEERLTISLSPIGNDTYLFAWNLSALQERGQHDISVSLEVADEVGLISKTDADTQITILNNVKPAVYFKSVNWILYVLAGIVLALSILVVIMWRRLGDIAAKGGQVLGRIAREIRKTLVGGGRRGKALAGLKILDGPTSMIGEDVKIFTEKVSLGRDPKLSDLTFYTPDANSSVSGLHAILERVNDKWRLVAVSQSRSETFVDNVVVPFNDPVYINSGQQVRLGYLAQQPVVFEFQAQASSTTETADFRKTDVGDKTTPVGLIKIDKDQEQKIKQEKSNEKESLFDEYL